MVFELTFCKDYGIDIFSEFEMLFFLTRSLPAITQLGGSSVFFRLCGNCATNLEADVGQAHVMMNKGILHGLT